MGFLLFGERWFFHGWSFPEDAHNGPASAGALGCVGWNAKKAPWPGIRRQIPATSAFRSLKVAQGERAIGTGRAGWREEVEYNEGVTGRKNI
jgi:hypothetical protein